MSQDVKYTIVIDPNCPDGVIYPRTKITCDQKDDKGMPIPERKYTGHQAVYFYNNIDRDWAINNHATPNNLGHNILVIDTRDKTKLMFFGCDFSFGEHLKIIGPGTFYVNISGATYLQKLEKVIESGMKLTVTYMPGKLHPTTPGLYIEYFGYYEYKIEPDLLGHTNGYDPV